MTLEDIDRELARLPATPKTDADLDARAALMARRIQIDQAAKVAADANSRPKPRGNLTVNVPPSMGVSNYYSAQGRSAQSRTTDDGRLVIDLFAGEFKSLLMGRDGLEWQNANHELLALIAQQG